MPRIFLLLLVALFLAKTVSPDPPAVLLSVTPAVVYAPATIQFKIIVEPNSNNRILCWGWDSEEGSFRSSCEELEGELAPKTYWFTYSDVGSGHYEAFAQVFRAPRALVAGTATTKFRVLPEIGDPND